jgi:hypothetical protein
VDQVRSMISRREARQLQAQADQLALHF